MSLYSLLLENTLFQLLVKGGSGKVEMQAPDAPDAPGLDIPCVC